MTSTEAAGPDTASTEAPLIIEGHHGVRAGRPRLRALIAGLDSAVALAIAVVTAVVLITGRRLDWALLSLAPVSLALALSLAAHALRRRTSHADGPFASQIAFADIAEFGAEDPTVEGEPTTPP